MDAVHSAANATAGLTAGLATGIERNRYTSIAVAAAVAVVGVIAAQGGGCANTIRSALTGESVSVEVFTAELDAARVQAEADARADERNTARTVATVTAQAERDIQAAIGLAEDRADERATAVTTLELTGRAAWDAYEREQATKNAIYQALSTVAGTAFPGFAPLLGSAGMLLGIGAVVDNRRKDRIIRRNGNMASIAHPGAGA